MATHTLEHSSLHDLITRSRERDFDERTVIPPDLGDIGARPRGTK